MENVSLDSLELERKALIKKNTTKILVGVFIGFVILVVMIIINTATSSKYKCKFKELIVKKIIEEELGSTAIYDPKGGISLSELNSLRERYLQTKDVNYLIRGKRLLPASFKQKRTVNTNYAELMNIYLQRKNHRLKEEWQEVFCKWCESLPYFMEFIEAKLK